MEALAVAGPLLLPDREPSRSNQRELRRPGRTVLYQVISRRLETFLAQCSANAEGLPDFVEREVRRYLECGILAHGFLRLRCDTCEKEQVVAFSC